MCSSDPDLRARHALTFLAYDEKFLAGSWRFLTYFGRDTLLSLRLLMPVLTPRAIEAGLGSVLDRLSAEGDVAHEEEVGEFPSLRRALTPGLPGKGAEPLHDYKMVDDDFLLAPVLARYLLDTPDGRTHAQAFLARQTPGGRSYAEALLANLARVQKAATPFAAAPGTRTLIALQEGSPVGEWRDSTEGLGLGRYAYNVNAALVPAALDAAARLLDSPLLEGESAQAHALAEAWRDAGRFFQVELPREEAERRLRAHAAEVGGVPLAGAVSSLEGPLRFHAISLDEQGVPVPVMHSDDGFVLLFTRPSPDALVETLRRVLAPYPAGLLTPVGMLVANPAFAESASLRALFTRDRYHGTVVWSWQQALFAAGLAEQLERKDLPAEARAAVLNAQTALWTAIDATRELRTSELWSWTLEKGAFRVQPFGQGASHADESNAAQLWSTVYLAVKRP